MRKIVGFIIILCLVIGLVINSVQVEAAMAEPLSIREITVTPEELSDGITIFITRNSDGTYNQTVYDDASVIPVPMATADGVLEWAEFHVGFKDWTNYAGDLYFTVKADEPMLKISGKAYVSPLNALLKDYHNKEFSSNLYSSYNTSRTLAEDVDTGDATRVKVGFKTVILWTSTGDEGAFENASKIVER